MTQWKLPGTRQTRQQTRYLAAKRVGARRGARRLTDLHAGEDDVVLGALAVAADAVAGLDLLEVDPAEVGAAGDEVAPEVGVVGIVDLGGLLGRLGLLLSLGTVVGDHAVVFGLHG